MTKKDLGATQMIFLFGKNPGSRQKDRGDSVLTPRLWSGEEIRRVG